MNPIQYTRLAAVILALTVSACSTAPTRVVEVNDITVTRRPAPKVTTVTVTKPRPQPSAPVNTRPHPAFYPVVNSYDQQGE